MKLSDIVLGLKKLCDRYDGVVTEESHGNTYVVVCAIGDRSIRLIVEGVRFFTAEDLEE